MSQLDVLMNDVNKKFKSDIFHRGVKQYDYVRIPFTSPRLNYMTFGGIPQGKLVEFYGEEHSGKTTSALDNLANYQRMDDAKSVIYVDVEHSLDPVWATKLGVDLDSDKFIMIDPEISQGAETLFDIVLSAMETGEVGYVVIDSIGALFSDAESEKSIGEKTYGGVSMALTKFSKKAEMLCAKHKCTLVGINQLRADMNSLYGGMRTPGGEAWKYFCSVRLEFRKGKYFDEKGNDLNQSAENPYGNYVLVTMKKNKTCPPTRRTGYYSLTYCRGIDYLRDLVDVAVKYDLIQKAGAWFAIIDPDTGEELAKVQGQARVYEYLSDNFDVLKKVESFMDDKIQEGLNVLPEEVEVPNELEED